MRRLLIGLLIIALAAVPVLFLRGTTYQEVALAEDTATIQYLLNLALRTPLRQGSNEIDFYALARQRGLSHKELTSKRLGIGPTADEFARGDYAHFPWNRHQGRVDPQRRPAVPVLWEPTPDRHGVILVGLSDGTVRRWAPADITAALARD